MAYHPILCLRALGLRYVVYKENSICGEISRPLSRFIFVFDIAVGSMACFLEQNEVSITEYEVFSLKDWVMETSWQRRSIGSLMQKGSKRMTWNLEKPGSGNRIVFGMAFDLQKLYASDVFFSNLPDFKSSFSA